MDVGYMGNGGKLDSALRDNTVSMILNLIEYDLDIMENGVINLSMNYKARIEQDLADKFDYDIFFDPGRIKRNERIRQIEQSIGKGAKKIHKMKATAEGYTDFIDRLDEKGTATPETMGEQLLTITEIREKTKARVERKELYKRISKAEGKINTLRASVNEMEDGNKVSKYGRLLEVLFREGKIKRTWVPKTALVIYGEEFEKALQDKIDAMAKELGLTETEDIVRAANQIRNQVREQVKKTGVDHGKFSDLNFAQVINKRVKADGITVKEAILKTDFSKEVNDAREVGTGTTEGYFSSINWMNKAADKASAWWGDDEADSKPEFAEYEKIYWFHLGDLIHLLMQNNDIAGKLKRDKLGFIFGPIGIDVGGGEFVQLANIADIPITLEMYQTFFFKNIVEKDLDQYFLHDFIKQAMYQLLTPSLNQKCFGTSTSNPISVNSVIIETASPIKTIWDDSNTLATVMAEGNRYSMNTAFKEGLSKSRIGVKDSKPDERYSYVMFYSNNGRTDKGWKGNRAKDMEKGIFHFAPGVDRGLVKQVKFRKNKKPGFTTMMVEKAFAENKESMQLWAMFDIDLSLIGNTLLKPGMHIYLDPSTVGMGSPQSLSSFSRSIGIGGYYLVISVSNTISDGDWETNVIAKWVSSGTAAPTAARIVSSAAARESIPGVTGLPEGTNPDGSIKHSDEDFSEPSPLDEIMFGGGGE